jgi:hypothetical protein
MVPGYGSAALRDRLRTKRSGVCWLAAVRTRFLGSVMEDACSEPGTNHRMSRRDDDLARVVLGVVASGGALAMEGAILPRAVRPGARHREPSTRSCANPH